jgi:hypothetical protein
MVETSSSHQARDNPLQTQTAPSRPRGKATTAPGSTTGGGALLASRPAAETGGDDAVRVDRKEQPRSTGKHRRVVMPMSRAQVQP